MKQVVALSVLLLVVIAAASQEVARGGSSDVKEAWAGEEAYWRYVQARDEEHFRTLWADDFVGWPIVREHPSHKADVRLSSGTLSSVTSYELHRESVDSHGPVVITFYRANVRRREAEGHETTTTSRLTHTWMKRGGVWQIVGGMSADDAPSGASPR